MALYTAAYAGVTLSTSADIRTLITTATGQGSVIRVPEFYIGGEASSSTVTRVQINRPGTAGVTPTTVATVKVDPASVNSAFTVASTWSTQPVVSATDLVTIAFNAFGGVVRLVQVPGAEWVVGSQGAVANLTSRSLSGTPVCSGYFLVEER